MRLPKRRAQLNKLPDEESRSREVTPEALERLKRTLNDLEKRERPKIVEDLAHAITLGDFSENAEYQDAKARLARIDGRIFGLKERIKYAVVIKKTRAGSVGLGSTVTVASRGKTKTYEILGPQESDPSKGKISYLSPLGASLMGHKTGDRVEFQSPAGSIESLEIVSIA